MIKVAGLRWTNSGGERIAMWRASKPAIRAEFPVKSRPLWRGTVPTQAEIDRMTDRCIALSNEQRDWLRGKRGGRPNSKASIKGEVYFVRAGDNVKIGFTINLQARLRQLQTGATEGLELLGTIPCGADRERLIQLSFARYRVRGEWFRIEGDLADFIHSRFHRRIDGATGAPEARNAL